MIRRFLANLITVPVGLLHILFMIVLLWLDEDVLRRYLDGIVKASAELDRPKSVADLAVRCAAGPPDAEYRELVNAEDMDGRDITQPKNPRKEIHDHRNQSP